MWLRVVSWLGVGALALAATLPVQADPEAAIRAKYGARPPAVCADRTAPRGGAAMTPELARSYARCHAESESSMGGSYLYLLENVTLRVGKPRPYNPDADYLRTDIDIDAPLYPVKGSYDRYQCMPVVDHGAGRNCNLSVVTEATGTCYRDGFGDWTCSIHGPDAEYHSGVAPPPS